MTKLDPFTDDAASACIGKSTIENGTDQVTLYGSLDIIQTNQAAHARQMKALPAEVAPALAPKMVKNPSAELTSRFWPCDCRSSRR